MQPVKADDPSPQQDMPQTTQRVGLRIDFILASAELAKYCKTAEVANRRELDMLSDHYPVVADFELPDENGASNPLRIVTYNVLEGFHRAPERAEKVAAWLRQENPDVVALQELNRFTPEKLSEYAAQWGHCYAVLLKEKGYSTGLTSRTPIEAVRRIRDGFGHGLLIGETVGIRFYVVHYAPRDNQQEKRNRETRLTLEDIAAQEQTGKPVIVLGDFNSLSPHDDPQNDSPRTFPLKKFMDAGFVDLALEHRKGAAFTPSAPTPLRGN